MRLFLAGKGSHPDTIQKLSTYLGGLKDKTIAYIPTAANGGGWESWKEGGAWQELQNLGAQVTIVQLEDYRDESVVDLIKGKDILWFAGGYSAYLLYWIRRCQLDKHLNDILDSNTLYVGASAGSMITSLNQEVSEWFLRDQEPGAAFIPGLDLVDFQFYPHYTDDLYDAVKAKYTGKKMYLVKDGDVVLVENGLIKVLGEEIILTN
jgi:dipeptidase E